MSDYNDSYFSLLKILKTNKELKKKIEKVEQGCLIKFFYFVDGKKLGSEQYITDVQDIILDKNGFVNTVKTDFGGIHSSTISEIIGKATFQDLECFIQSKKKKISIDDGKLFINDKEIPEITFDMNKELISQDIPIIKKLNKFLQVEFRIPIYY